MKRDTNKNMIYFDERLIKVDTINIELNEWYYIENVETSLCLGWCGRILENDLGDYPNYSSKQSEESRWQICETRDQHYSMYNEKSNGYCDGRNPHSDDPLITNRNPYEDIYLQWEFIKISEEIYAIQSVSGKKFLDGTSQDRPLLKDGDPFTERFLQWRFLKANGSSVDNSNAIIKRSLVKFVLYSLKTKKLHFIR
eukprot:TRINITY_DN14085_c0_g1_i1.p1 TRINITY_DN14085_c0_g1~~TRINITY_DN14085_c0_g1_i1.p1  ORF type:complete len:211 (-),score=33.57 TRINITY_DN14085_c0_g1_i1:262-852(-)